MEALGSRTKLRYANLSAQRDANRTVLTEKIVGRVPGRRNYGFQSRGSKILSRAREAATVRRPRMNFKNGPAVPPAIPGISFREKWENEAAKDTSRAGQPRKAGSLLTGSSLTSRKAPDLIPVLQPPPPLSLSSTFKLGSTATSPSAAHSPTAMSPTTSLVKPGLHGMINRSRRTPSAGPVDFFASSNDSGQRRLSSSHKGKQAENHSVVVAITKRKVQVHPGRGSPTGSAGSGERVFSPPALNLWDAGSPGSIGSARLAASPPPPQALSTSAHVHGPSSPPPSIDFFGSNRPSGGERIKRKRPPNPANVIVVTKKKVKTGPSAPTSASIGTSASMSSSASPPSAASSLLPPSHPAETNQESPA